MDNTIEDLTLDEKSSYLEKFAGEEVDSKNSSGEIPRLPWSSRWRGGKKNIDLDAVATQRSVFDDPAQAKFYQPHENYENLHRFDVAARWTVREEKAVVRKIDWKIMTWVCHCI